MARARCEAGCGNCSRHPQGRRNYFEVGGGGGAKVSRGPRQPLPKTQNSPDLAHCFLGETQVHVQKQTKIKLNDIDSPKLGGGGVAPLPPGSRVPGRPPPQRSFVNPCLIGTVPGVKIG